MHRIGTACAKARGEDLYSFTQVIASLSSHTQSAM